LLHAAMLSFYTLDPI